MFSRCNAVVLTNYLKRSEKHYNKKHWRENAISFVNQPLLLTSFNLGKISKPNPSAWPLCKLPPFMKFPKARIMAMTFFSSFEDVSFCKTRPRNMFTLKNINDMKFAQTSEAHTSQIAFILLNLFRTENTASLNSDWMTKHAIRSAKYGISLNSNKNCSGLSRIWSGWFVRWSFICLISSLVAL